MRTVVERRQNQNANAVTLSRLFNSPLEIKEANGIYTAYFPQLLIKTVDLYGQEELLHGVSQVPPLANEDERIWAGQNAIANLTGKACNAFALKVENLTTHKVTTYKNDSMCSSRFNKWLTHLGPHY